MFYYYGRKEKIFKYYPKPKHDTIIEPFAGSAVYSLKNFKKNIIILDKDERIINIWNYLKEVTSDEILSLPLLTVGQSLNDEEFENLTIVQKDLISFFTNPSSAQPKRSVGKFNIWHKKNRKRLSEDVNKIRHWKILLGDYRDIPNQEATWFIDPPYQGNGGKYYKHGNKNINYDELSLWVQNRNGQVIVCENSEANWLPFIPLKRLQGQRHKTIEVIWQNNLINNQISLNLI
jgi:site-specific DNA-adenine methylase